WWCARQNARSGCGRACARWSGCACARSANWPCSLADSRIQTRRPGVGVRRSREVGSISTLSMLITPAYAKLNLALAVVARREDGWHDIDSVLAPIDWHDLIGVEIGAAEAVAVSLRLSGPAASGVPAGSDNLSVRAAHALSAAARLPLDIRI